MLFGLEGAVGWLVEMLRVGAALVSSKCWWMLLVFVGVGALESVGDVGVTCTVVGCWLLDAEVGAVGWLRKMVTSLYSPKPLSTPTPDCEAVPETVG